MKTVAELSAAFLMAGCTFGLGWMLGYKDGFKHGWDECSEFLSQK